MGAGADDCGGAAEFCRCMMVTIDYILDSITGNKIYTLPNRPLTVVDVGCGGCMPWAVDIDNHISTKGRTVKKMIGIDLEPDELYDCDKEHFGERLLYIQGNATNLAEILQKEGIKEVDFATIITPSPLLVFASYFSLLLNRHIATARDYLDMLGQLNKVLEDDGILAILLGQGEKEDSKWWVNALRESGFQIVDEEYFKSISATFGYRCIATPVKD